MAIALHRHLQMANWFYVNNNFSSKLILAKSMANEKRKKLLASQGVGTKSSKY